jgi:hypothetical protein
MSNDTAMRVEVTHMRAPWPAGAGVGSIVEIAGDTLPGCFIGKCKPAQPNARATYRYEPPQPITVEPILSEANIAAAADCAANLDFLVAKRDALRARMQAIDLPGAEKRVRDADAMLAASPGDIAPGAPGAGETPAQTERRTRYERAATEAKAARVGLRSLQEELQAISVDLKYVEHLLGAESRVESARAAALDADALAAKCRTAVIDAEAAVQRIVSLVESEEHAYQAARDEAGARILEAIKSGAEGVPVDAASRDKIASLEVAKRGAEEELQAASAAHQAAQQARGRAWQQVRLAQAAVVELAFRQVEREYIETLTQLYVAKNQARAGRFAVVDPRPEAIHRSTQICQSMA